MNPVPLALWSLAGGGVGLALHLALGWSWTVSLAVGLVAAPGLLWSLGALLDRIESGGRPAQPSRPWLVLESAPACPRCGSESSAEILFGLPGMSEDLMKALEEKRVVLAGCLVYAGAPRWLCHGCGARHGHAGPDDPAGEAVRGR